MQLNMRRDPLVAGVVFLGMAGLLLFLKLPFLTRGMRVEGVVVDVKEGLGRKGKRTYRPVVTFHAERQTITFTSDIGTGSNSYRIGSVVPVIYLPDQPEQATLGTFTHLWLAPFVCGVCGSLGLLVALLGWRVTRVPSNRELYRQALCGWNPHQETRST